ncbi:MAG: hypothetical protein AB1540_16300, partial [Bdellovibrionota bacterium]
MYLLILISSLLLPAGQPAFAHQAGESGHGHASAQEEKSGNFEKWLGLYEQLIESSRKLEAQAYAAPASDRVALRFGGETRYYNVDAFSEVFFHALRIYLHGVKDECGSSCATLDPELMRELDAVDPFLKRKIREVLSKASRIGDAVQKFFIEIIPNVNQGVQHQGAFFAAYFAITETLDHTVLLPVTWGIPLCKFLIAAYSFIADPIRRFFGVGFNQAAGFQEGTSFSNRVNRGIASWILRRKFKERVKFALIELHRDGLAVDQKTYRKHLVNKTREFETRLSKTSFWAESYSFFNVAENKMLGAKLSPLTAKIGFEADLNSIFSNDPVKVRHERAVRLIEGLKIMRDVSSESLEALYFEKTRDLESVSWKEYNSVRGWFGRFALYMDLISYNLEYVSTLQGGAENLGTLKANALRSLESLFELHWETVELIKEEEPLKRKQILENLSRKTADALQRERKISKGAGCE